MKSTVVPAQITSVEDRIMGNFTFAQVLLLIVPLLVGTVLYVGIAPHSHFSILKVSLILIQFAFFGGLGLRINGKIMAQWLVIYATFYRRPRFYRFTKNDLAFRDVVMPTAVKPELTERPTSKLISPVALPRLTQTEQLHLDDVLNPDAVSVAFVLGKKGGINVSLTPVKD